MKRTLGLVGAAAMLASTAIGVAAPAAHAESAAAVTPSVLCGPGFTLAKQENVVRFGDPVPAGTFNLMYNRFADTFCGVTVKTRFVGASTDTMAAVGGANPGMVVNSGPRLVIAGPVFDRTGDFASSGRCVLYGASVTDPQGNAYFHETANPAIGWSMYCLP
jgi:hypothetical protein